MRLLLVEPETQGHHMVLYTRLIFREAVSRGWSVTILTTESGQNHAAFGIISADHGAAPRTIIMDDVGRRGTSSIALLSFQLDLWKALARASSANNHFSDFDLIYCINLDYFEKVLSLRGSPFGDTPFAGMLMNPKFHRAQMGLGPPSRGDLFYRILFKRLLKFGDLTRLMVIDPLFREFCSKMKFARAEKIRVVSDVGELSAIESKNSARERLEISSKAFVVLLYGSLSPRKGVEQLLRAVQNVNDSEVVALVAGKPDRDITALLSSTWCREMQGSGQLFVRAEFHDDESEARVFGAADLVWLGYVGGSYGSSGVLYQAGSAGLPVIAGADGLIGWTVRKRKIGISLNPNNTHEVAAVIQRLKHDKNAMRKLGENGRRLAEGHTGAAFAKIICSALAESVSDYRKQ